MKTIVVISDTHGNAAAVKKIENIMLESDYVIFLGDGLRDIMPYLIELKKKLIFVTGNCDLYSCGERYGVLEVEKVRIFYTHGDLFGVKSNLLNLLFKAKELDCSVALYGHTHKANDEDVEGVKLFNPGCMSLYGTENSYGYIVINGEKCVSTIVPIM